MPRAPSSKRRLSSASLESVSREEVLSLDMTSRRASDGGIKFRPPLTPGKYYGQKRSYNRRPSRAQEGIIQRAASEPQVDLPIPTQTLPSIQAEESAPASANDLTLPSLAPESMASYPEDFWTYYSQVEPSNAGAASSPEGSYAGPNHQDVEHLLNESRQRGEQIMWPKFHPNEFRTAVVVETPQPSIVTAPPYSFFQAGPSSAPPFAAFTFPTSQHGLPPVDPSFAAQYSPSGQTAINDLAYVRIARRVSPTRTDADNVSFGVIPAPSTMHDPFQLPTSYHVPPFSPSSSSLLGALHDPSNYRDPLSYEARSESTNYISSLSVGDANGYAPMPQSYSQTPTEAEDCVLPDPWNMRASNAADAFDRHIVDDDGYMQNFARDPDTAAPSYAGL